MRSTQYLSAIAALVAPAFAQTFSACNPLNQKCPADPALGKSVAYDFTSGAPSGWTPAAGQQPTFNSSGGFFSITGPGQAPTLASNWYIMFGHYKVVMKPAAGAGIVSSLVLLSDDLDEIDIEWVGSQTGQVQTNYFGKGNTATYDRGATLKDGNSPDGFNTYEIDWTADHVQWIINGNVVRTLTPATADANQYPQSPMQMKLGNWPAGDSSNSGTSGWAGGKVNYANAPFNMIVKSVEVTDYSTGNSYSYGDNTGNWQSIVSSGGKISGSGSVPASVSTASAGGSTVTAAPTASALTGQQAITATTTNSAQISSGAAASPTTGTGSSSSSSISGSPSGSSIPSGSSSSTASIVGGNPNSSGTGVIVPTPATTTSTSSTSSPAVVSSGGASNIKPMVGVAAAGLFAFFAL